MATYVLVDADGIDKEIKGGPLELDNPNDYVVQEGQKLMTQAEAQAQGYYFPSGGAAFAPDQAAGDAGTSVQDEQGGSGDRGPQGIQGGQGSQVQPGATGEQNQQ